MMKGLLIQGPLMSKGRTGATANIPFNSVKDEHVVDYDCIHNISNLYEKYKEVFDYIVCVTWGDQDKALLTRLRGVLPDKNILLIDDTTECIAPKGNVIQGNNKYRQMLSVLKGSEVLNSLGCDYIVKVRTDQFVNCELLLNDTVNKLCNDNRPIVMVPWINDESSHSKVNIEDLYFSSRADTLVSFAKEYLETPEIRDSIHQDLFYKWTFRRFISKRILRKYISKVSVFGNSVFLMPFYLKSNGMGLFFPLCSDAVDSIVWRGEVLDIDKSHHRHIKIEYGAFSNMTSFKCMLSCLLIYLKKNLKKTH